MYLPSYGNSIRLVLADDHLIFRETLERFLQKHQEFNVVGMAADGEELIQLVEKLQPDIVVTDLKMPNLNGIEVTKVLKSRYPKIGIIAFTLHSDDYYILGMLRAGGDGYLLKSMFETEVADAIKIVFNEGIYYCNIVSNRILKLLTRPENSKSRNSSHSLSEKEMKIMQLICQQLSSKEISSILNIPLRTVENCRERIQEKIGARNMAGIVTYAIKTGIYDIE